MIVLTPLLSGSTLASVSRKQTSLVLQFYLDIDVLLRERHRPPCDPKLKVKASCNDPVSTATRVHRRPNCTFMATCSQLFLILVALLIVKSHWAIFGFHFWRLHSPTTVSRRRFVRDKCQKAACKEEGTSTVVIFEDLDVWSCDSQLSYPRCSTFQIKAAASEGPARKQISKLIIFFFAEVRLKRNISTEPRWSSVRVTGGLNPGEAEHAPNALPCLQ